MAADVSLPSRVLGRKIKKFGSFWVKNIVWGILGRGYCPCTPWRRLCGKCRTWKTQELENDGTNRGAGK